MPGTLTSARRRGSTLTLIGTHLDSVYRAKIQFQGGGGGKTEATVSTRAGSRHRGAVLGTVPAAPCLPTGVRGPAVTQLAAVPQPGLPH